MARLPDFIATFTKNLRKLMTSLEGKLTRRITSNEIELILNTHLFKKMSNDELAQLMSSTHLISYKAGTVILEEGEVSSELYVISEGEACVFIEDAHKHKIQLSTLSTGSYFGEQAIYGDKVKTRNACVEALTDITLVAIKGKYLKSLINKDESLKSVIQERKLSQSVNIVSHASIFQHEIETLLANLENPHVIEYQDKDCIFQAGDKSDLVYMVIQGKVKLFIPQKNTASLTELVLNKGHLFGELGVMNQAPRAATAIAMGNVRLLGIDDTEFLKDVSISASFKSMLSSLQQLYTLPMRGKVEQSVRFTPEDGNVVQNIYTLNDGRVIHSIKVLDKESFTMMVLNKEAGNCYQFNDDGNTIEVYVLKHRLIGIKAMGDCLTLSDLCYTLLDDVDIDTDDIERFKQTGSFSQE